MANNNKNNKRRSKYSGNDEFNWEEYDILTSTASSSAASRKRILDDDTRTYSRSSASSAQSQHNSSSAPPTRRRRPQSGAKKRKKKQLTENQIRFRKRLRLTLFAALFICIVIVSGITVGMYAAVKKEIQEMNIRNLAHNTASFIYYTDKYGQTQELDQIASESSRIWVDSTQISQYMKDAIVSIEDERFYKHHGVDIKRTVGATAKYVLAKVGIGSSDYGGSTITQQVIKNITKETEKTSSRKIKEIMRAIALEKELTKDEILNMYLNIAFFGNNCNGVESAANTYFNKNASELTLTEAASIAGITQYPSEYEPINHPENNVEKRNRVLGKMYELGKISESDYQVAVTSELVLDTSYRQKQAKVTSYFVDQIVNDVISDLQSQKGYSEDFATQQVYNGGLKIYATIDTGIQEIMENTFENSDYAGGKSQAAMVVIDPYTGQIKGLIGGLGTKTDIRGWNRATQAKRQPGSSIKPLSVYAPALDKGKITESTVITDEEIEIGNDKWKPKNSYNDFYGDMSVKEAVARSANIPAVKVLDELGVSTSYGYLQNQFHLSTLDEGDKNYSSLALGGLTNGVTVRDMAGAYSVFANNGQYITPHTYTQVVDSTGTVVLENRETGTQSISAAAAFITSDLLYGVVNSSLGTGKRALLDSGMPTYGKTGTTDDDCDKWFVGYTPYYVGAVWFGFDNPASLSAYGISGNPSVYLWNSVMEKIHSGLSKKEFAKPINVVEANVCIHSGMLATATCESTTSYFVDGTQPKAPCNYSHASGSVKSTPSSSPSASSLPTPTAVTVSTASPQAVQTSKPSSQSGTNSSNIGNTGTGSGTNSGSSNSSSGNVSNGSGNSSSGNVSNGSGNSSQSGTSGNHGSSSGDIGNSDSSYNSDADSSGSISSDTDSNSSAGGDLSDTSDEISVGTEE